LVQGQLTCATAVVTRTFSGGAVAAIIAFAIHFTWRRCRCWLLGGRTVVWTVRCRFRRLCSLGFFFGFALASLFFFRAGFQRFFTFAFFAFFGLSLGAAAFAIFCGFALLAIAFYLFFNFTCLGSLKSRQAALHFGLGDPGRAFCGIGTTCARSILRWL
jgi:hypothetical protein